MSAVPDAVTCDTVPARPAGAVLEWVEVDSELVVWNAERGELHHLDPIASLVFELCDGVTPLGDTVRDLAEVFQQPQEQIESDVQALLVALAGHGLVLLD